MRRWPTVAFAFVGLLSSTLVARGEVTGSAATPKASCAPGSHPERGLQGRMSADDIASGYASEAITCNMEIVGRYGSKGFAGGSAGGFKVLRYVDPTGHECAYYDSTLIFPVNAHKAATDRLGVYVLDMTDPARPSKTANLMTPAMLSPHESLGLNGRRGLLAAVSNFTMNPGFVDVYDLTKDCRRPLLMSSTPFGILGHEGNFSPDGNTFWASSGGGAQSSTLTAIDVTDPARPSVAWLSLDYKFHGLSFNEDGTRLYGADLGDPPFGTDRPWGLRILDVSEVQARVPNAKVNDIARISWDNYSVPQMTIPVTIGGQPYLIEIDELARDLGAGDPAKPIGAARIIDIADERNPVIVSDIRLEVHEPGNVALTANDPGARFPEGGYSGHYCSVPRHEEPGIVACSFILSGLRVFDIRDPHAPKEIAYFNAPIPPSNPAEAAGNAFAPFNAPYAMSAPAFVPDRREIWYSDGSFGFFNVRLINNAWPQ